MSARDQRTALLLIWCAVIPSAAVTFAVNGAGWARLLPALILLTAGAAATMMFAPTVFVNPNHPEPVPDAPTASNGWTPRELQILCLIAQGCTNDEIAESLVIARSTVKTHINNLYRKLGVRNRVQAATRARALGLV